MLDRVKQEGTPSARFLRGKMKGGARTTHQGGWRTGEVMVGVVMGMVVMVMVMVMVVAAAVLCWHW